MLHSKIARESFSVVSEKFEETRARVRRYSFSFFDYFLPWRLRARALISRFHLSDEKEKEEKGCRDAEEDHREHERTKRTRDERGERRKTAEEGRTPSGRNKAAITLVLQLTVRVVKLLIINVPVVGYDPAARKKATGTRKSDNDYCSSGTYFGRAFVLSAFRNLSGAR